MGIFETLKEVALRAEHERLKMLDKVEQQDEDFAMRMAKVNRQGKDVRPQDLAFQKQMLKMSSDMAGSTGGITRAVKNYGPVLGKYLNKFAPYQDDLGKPMFPIDKQEIVSHFRRQYPAAIKNWPKGKDTWSNTYGAQQVDRYKKAVKFLKEKGYLPAGQEGYFKGIGDEFEVPKGMKQESVFSAISPKAGSRTGQAMQSKMLKNEYIHDSILEDYLDGLAEGSHRIDNEFLTDKVPRDVYKKYITDKFLKRGD